MKAITTSQITHSVSRLGKYTENSIVSIQLNKRKSIRVESQALIIESIIETIVEPIIYKC